MYFVQSEQLFLNLMFVKKVFVDHLINNKNPCDEKTKQNQQILTTLM